MDKMKHSYLKEKVMRVLYFITCVFVIAFCSIFLGREYFEYTKRLEENEFQERVRRARLVENCNSWKGLPAEDLIYPTLVEAMCKGVG
ncbi:hypothetical protein, partial [Bacteroides stercoris]|uniref:hypothetical protein n=1 Tax=Bacteroides stercoris TaxID=46506 RepID=UPI00125E27BB